MKRIVGILAVALVIFFVITSPDSAANSVHKVGGMLSNAAHSTTTFFTRVVG